MIINSNSFLIFCFHNLQIDGGCISDITLMSFTLFPKSIAVTFKQKLQRIVAIHFRSDLDSHTWSMQPYPGQTVSNLLWKCQLVLSLVMGKDAFEIKEISKMCIKILNLYKQYFREHYFMRQRLGF